MTWTTLTVTAETCPSRVVTQTSVTFPSQLPRQRPLHPDPFQTVSLSPGKNRNSGLEWNGKWNFVNGNFKILFKIPSPTF